METIQQRSNTNSLADQCNFHFLYYKVLRVYFSKSVNITKKKVKPKI